MQTPKKFLVAFVVIVGPLAAQTPTITGVVNASSALPPGLPNYAIAAGSIFVVYGSNLGAPPPAGAVVNSAPIPLPTTGYAGTSISVTINGTTLPAPILYTSPGQLAGIMPSATPAGNGTLSVTYGAQTVSSPVTVLSSAFGISNLRIPSGHETAALTFGSNQSELVTVADSAAPGDVLVMYGTGLGPATGNIDTTNPQAGNIGAAPVVYVGGVASTNVSYYGRSPALPGLDQIIFTVPMNAPLGCHVSIVVQTTNAGVPIVSNAPATALAATDHTPCVDPVNAFPAQILSLPISSTILGISLMENQSFLPTPGSTQLPTTPAITDTYQILASQFTPTQFLGLSLNLAESTEGSCFAGFVPNVATPAALPPATYLDIGTSITLTPPSGSPLILPATAAGVFLGKDSLGVPFGAWGFSSPGGANVGPLNFQFPIAQPITWTNQASLMTTPVTRSNGLTISWTGGDAVNGYVDIQGFAANSTGTFLVGYDCSAPIQAGSFTIPPSILLRMPAGAAAFSTLQVSTFAYPFNTPSQEGFDAIANLSQLQTIIPIVYQ
jgi:uncharacterized protein (TIGR03437 family)